MYLYCKTLVLLSCFVFFLFFLVFLYNCLLDLCNDCLILFNKNLKIKKKKKKKKH